MPNSKVLVMLSERAGLTVPTTSERINKRIVVFIDVSPLDEVKKLKL